MADSDAKQIIASLRQTRQDQKVSQRTISEKLFSGNSQTLLYRYENSLHTPNIDTVCRWANTLGLELILQPKK